ncbi:MAG: glycosyltransferase family 2 protein [Patescibacteria group bacterium]
MHDINVVIVNYKTKNDIEKCLTSLFVDIKDSGLDVIVHVVDNSQNQDGIKDMLDDKFQQVVYIDPRGNVGFGKGENIGFKNYAAKFYLCLNPDVKFNMGFGVLKKMVKFMEENEKAGIIAPKLLNLDKTIQESCYRFPSFFVQISRRLNLDKKVWIFKKMVDYYLMKDFDHNKTVKVDWVMGSFMFASKKLVEKIGFFDERYFMYFEDCDWCLRAWMNGFEVWYLDNIIVSHEHKRQSAGKSSIISILKTPIARIHIKSWLLYFLKWGIVKKHFGV